MKATPHNGPHTVDLHPSGAELRRGDAIALIVSGLLALMICHLLVSDQYFFSRAYLPEPTTPLAEVVNPDQGVKHRSANVPLWRRTGSHQFLGEQDQVFTGRQSRAEIHFQESGAVLQLEPNSLVVIRRDRREAESNWFRLGRKPRSASAGTIVDVNGQEAVIAPGSRVQVARSREGKADIKVLAGRVTLTPVGQAVVSINANESATIGNHSEAATIIKPLPLKLVSPAFGEKIYVKDSPRPIKLAWSSSLTSPAQYRVEVRRASEPGNSSQHWITDRLFFDFTPPMTGEYHWQVSRMDQPDTAVSGRFTVVPLSLPLLRFPSPDLTIEQTVSQDNPIVFRWHASSADRYLLQVSTSADFSGPRTEVYVEGTMQVISSLAPSTWFWRVGGEIEGRIIWSQTQRFVIRPPTELEAPRAEAAVVTADRNVKLSWGKLSSSASGYQVDVGQNEDLSRTHTLLAASTPVIWTPPKPGIYYWQVRALASNNTLSPPSKKMQFEFPPTPGPSSTSPAITAPETPAPELPSTEDTFQGKSIAAIPEAPLREKGRPPVEPVAQQKLAAREPTSNLIISLSSPNLIEYADPAQTGVSLELSWRGIDAATSYIVQLSHDKNFNAVKDEWTTTEPSVLLGSLDQTSYWRVRPAGSDVVWSEVGKLELLEESPIRITSVITADNAPRVKLKWQASRLTDGEVIIRQSSSGKIVYSQPISDPEGSLNPPTLPPGAYEWHIRSLSPRRRLASRVDHFSIAVQSDRPGSTTPGPWSLQFVPYASRFDYHSSRAPSQDYSSTDFSAGSLFEASFTKSSVQGFLQYQIDYSEYFLIEDDQEPESVINQGFALGGGYQFAVSAWRLVPRVFFLNQDFVTVSAWENQLNTESSSADWLAASFNVSYSWQDLVTGVELLRSMVHLNANDFATAAELTQIKGYVQHGIGSGDRLNAIYGISFRSFHADLDAEDGYVESNATAASIGLNLLL